MIDYQIILEKQFSYVKDILLTRKDNFHESFEKPLFEGEPTAAEVYMHGLNSFYKSCVKLISPEKNNSELKLEVNRELGLPSQYIELYERTLQIFKELLQKMAEENLNKHIVFPLNPEKTISIIDWIGLNITHTAMHVGQALRLQALYIRNISDEG